MNLVLLIHINGEAEGTHPLKFLYQDLFHNTGTLDPNYGHGGMMQSWLKENLVRLLSTANFGLEPEPQDNLG